MGQRGFPPMPSVIRELIGNPGHKAINRKEPKPKIARAKCPPHIAEWPEAKAYWNYYHPRLVRLRVISELDIDVLADFCAARAETLALLKKWREMNSLGMSGIDGQVAFTKNDYPTVHPVWSQYLTSREYANKLGQQLGLTPASRCRLMVLGGESEGKDDKGVQYLNGNWNATKKDKTGEAKSCPVQ